MNTDIKIKQPQVCKENQDDDLLSVEFQNTASKADPMNLWGLWDGEETIEELLEELD